MTVPRPLSREIVAAVRRWQAALLRQDDSFAASTRCREAKWALQALLVVVDLSDQAPEPARRRGEMSKLSESRRRKLARVHQRDCPKRADIEAGPCADCARLADDDAPQPKAGARR